MSSQTISSRPQTGKIVGQPKKSKPTQPKSDKPGEEKDYWALLQAHLLKPGRRLAIPLPERTTQPSDSTRRHAEPGSPTPATRKPPVVHEGVVEKNVGAPTKKAGHLQKSAGNLASSKEVSAVPAVLAVKSKRSVKALGREKKTQTKGSKGG